MTFINKKNCIFNYLNNNHLFMIKKWSKYNKPALTADIGLNI